MLADVSTMPARNAEDSVDEVARAHGGHCVSPVDDGPLLVAFASAQDGVDAARELAGRLDARVAAVTGEAEPRAGSYRGETASAAARLLELAEPGQVLIDDATAETIDGRLPPELGLAEVRETSSARDRSLGARRSRAVDPAARRRLPLSRADGVRAGGR